MHASDLLILATYAFQLILIWFFPVPSAGSTAEMLFKLKKENNLSQNHPAYKAVQTIPTMIVIIIATLTVTLTALIPLIAIMFPLVVDYLFPFVKAPPNTLTFISVLLLISGNVLTLVAVRTLRFHVTFHEFGETTSLHTSGIYKAIRKEL